MAIFFAEAMADQPGRPQPPQQPSPPRHPVRSVADLLCGGPGAVHASSSTASPPAASPSPPTPARPRGGWARGPRGRFIERPLGLSPGLGLGLGLGLTPPLPPLPPPRAAGVSKRAGKKYYSNAAPSAHCHICARTSKSVRFLACARVRDARCRKVVCERCFVRFGWEWAAAAADAAWTCTHCRGACPPGRSQCFIYARVNAARERKRGGRGARAGAAGGGKAERGTGAASAKVEAAAETQDGRAEGAESGGGGEQRARFGEVGFESQKGDGRLPEEQYRTVALSSLMSPSGFRPQVRQTVYRSPKTKSVLSSASMPSLTSPISEVTATHSVPIKHLLLPMVSFSSHSAKCRP